MDRLTLRQLIREYIAELAGPLPSEWEMDKAAAVALAERVLSDHPEGSAHRIGHPRAVEVEAARARLQVAVKAYRAAWRPKVIRLS